MTNKDKLSESEIYHLLAKAAEARQRSYAPYSRFRVGCVVRASDGRTFYGCNVENVSYGLSHCAERTALFNAIAAGCKPKHFEVLAVVADGDKPVTPCGACRQVMAELCPSDMPVIMGNLSDRFQQETVADLLPFAFGEDTKDAIIP